LGLPADITVFTNGSGDTTYDYVSVLCQLVLALAAAVVWSMLDGRRREYARLHEALRIYVRYALAAVMFSYGFSKVFKLQFPFPHPGRLVQAYGDSSPMGLLWTFMGYSTPYTVFAGLGEVVGGALLLFRRTTTAGALVLIAVLTNIVMLNFSYDVPVKLFSSHLLLMAVFLALPDAAAIVDLFLRARPAQLARPTFPYGGQSRRARWARGALKAAVVAQLLYTFIGSDIERAGQYGDHAPQIAMAGVWDVEEMTRDGQPVPPGVSHWRQLSIRNQDFLIRPDAGPRQRFDLGADDAKRQLVLKPRPGEGGRVSTLAWTRLDDSHVLVEGPFGEAALRLRLKAVPTSGMLLVTRGFHWVNEYPFNR
jgi:uncharacterized membrane protein YphA (DoxX/SURF4 family)